VGCPKKKGTLFFSTFNGDGSMLIENTDQWLCAQPVLDDTNDCCHLLMSLEKRITYIMTTNIPCLLHAG